MQRKSKVFQLLINGKSDWVSIDRLKPAVISQGTGDPPISARTRSKTCYLDKPTQKGGSDITA